MYAHLSKFFYTLFKWGAVPAAPAASLSCVFANANGVLCYITPDGVVHPIVTQQGTGNFAVAGGTADAMTVTLAPAPTLTDGMQIRVRAVGANTVVNPTIDVNGGGALTIYKQGAQPLAVADIYSSGHEINLVYRASGPHWELQNPAPVAGGGGGNWTMIKKTADEARSSVTVVADDAALKVVLGVGTYHVRVRALVTAVGASGFKYGTAYSGTFSEIVTRRQYTNTFTTGTASVDLDQQAMNQTTLVTSSFTGGPGMVWFQQDLIITTTAPGTLSFQWAQNTSLAAALTIKRGSYLEYANF